MKNLFILLMSIILTSCTLNPNWKWGFEDTITVGVTGLLLTLFIVYILIKVYEWFKKRLLNFNKNFFISYLFIILV